MEAFAITHPVYSHVMCTKQPVWMVKVKFELNKSLFLHDLPDHRLEEVVKACEDLEPKYKEEIETIVKDVKKEREDFEDHLIQYHNYIIRMLPIHDEITECFKKVEKAFRNQVNIPIQTLAGMFNCHVFGPPHYDIPSMSDQLENAGFIFVRSEKTEFSPDKKMMEYLRDRTALKFK